MEGGLAAIWLLACAAFFSAGLPIAAVLFRRVRACAAAFALPVALAITTLVAYWIGRLSLRVGLFIGLAALAAAAIACFRRRHPSAALEARLVAETAAVFLGAFAFLLAVRAVDPAVYPGGGEKFLDFGLLASLLRTARLPPEDVWFAGEPVQYYYGGHLIAALLTRLTGIDPRYSYNLALATFYATLVTTAYGLAGAIAAQAGASRRVGGAVGAFLTGLASNLVTAAYVLLWTLPTSIARPLAAGLAARTDLAADALLVPPAEVSYWTASRVIDGTANEFPLFAWLNGDLHAHMMSTPFLLTVVAIGYAYARTPAADRRWRQFLLFGTLPPVVGLIAVINTWSFPTAVGLTWLALTFAPASPVTLLPRSVSSRGQLIGVVSDSSGSWRFLRRESRRIGAALGVACVVLVLAVCWSLPFWLGTASGRGLAVLPGRSSMSALLLVHGGFLLVFVPYLLDRARPHLDDALRAGVAFVLIVALAWVGDLAAVGLFGPLLAAAWLLARKHDAAMALSADDSRRLLAAGGRNRATNDSAGTDRAVSDRTAREAVGYEIVPLIAGLGLVLLVEFVYVDTQAGPGRYNTVFKTYMQVWICWAVAGGVVVARLLDEGFDGAWTVGVTDGDHRWPRVLVAALFVTTSLYGGFALTEHFGDPVVATNSGPTLDALAFVEDRHPEAASAIRWLDARDGQPTMVSAPGTDVYRWVNAPSSLTGVPTVAGWSHETGYRGRAAYYARVEDVNRIYTGTPARQTQLLERYDVQYVYVGPNERERYGPELSVDRLHELVVAFRNEAVTIYVVDHGQLSPRAVSNRSRSFE